MDCGHLSVIDSLTWAAGRVSMSVARLGLVTVLSQGPNGSGPNETESDSACSPSHMLLIA